MDVPFVDLKAQTRDLHDELEVAFWSVAERAAFTMGPELTKFEAAFAAFCGAEHCVGVSSGTDAVKLALLGAGVGPGDEVVLPVNTFIATAEAVSHLGATPVFCDCDPHTALLDPDALAAVCEEREGMLAAVVPVHLYGRPCDMAQILAVAGEHGLAVVEDACQAHGALYDGRPCGSFGVTAAFSFYPGKNLGALGDGGAVVTSDNAIAERLRLLRNHGQAEKQVHSMVGYCDRLHNLQAAFLSVKLAHLPAWNAARRAAAAHYDKKLRDVPCVLPIATAGDGGVAPGAVADVGAGGIVEPVYHLYVVRILGGGQDEDPDTDLAERLLADEAACDRPDLDLDLCDHAVPDGGAGRGLRDVQERGERRDEVRDSLAAAGVQSGIHYAVPLHLQPAYVHLGYRLGDFPVAERLATRIVSLPVFPGITAGQIDHVCDSLAAAVAEL